MFAFILYLFGTLMIVAGFMLLIKPALILDFINSNNTKPGLYAAAILFRLLLGLMLVVKANSSIHPQVISAIGWIAIIAAVSFLLMGRNNFSKFLMWIMKKVIPWARAGGIAALIFGGYLIYAFL